MDIDTGVIYQDDPRDELFLTGLQERGFLTEPSLAELEQVGAWDLLSRAGFPVKTFRLIQRSNAICAIMCSPVPAGVSAVP